MPAFLTFAALSAQTPDHRPLFRDLTLAVGAERVGLVGRNGAGKSTLLAIAAGVIPPASGSFSRSGSVGMLAQDWRAELTVAQALGVADALAVLDRITSSHASADDLADADWTLEARVEAAFVEAGLEGIALDRTIGSLSGGERMRVGVARLLIERPDLLLLDEPTNNLDAAGRAAIMRLVGGWRGGVLVASHDRALLEAMDRIVELSPVGVTVVGGGWSDFAAARDAAREGAAAESERAAAALRHSARQAQRQREAKDRRDKAGRAFAAKRSEPKILLGRQAERAENSGGRIGRQGERQIEAAQERADAARLRVEVVTPLTIALPPSGIPSDAQLVALDLAGVTLGNRQFGPWTLSLRGPERVAVIGPNGSGKTTLLRLAAGGFAPTQGTVRRAEGRILMLDQHLGLLDPAASVLANVRRLNPSFGAEAAHAACARFAFRNRAADQPVGTLSGGERLRAGLAATLGGERPPWLLVLDEPTNHLDMDSVELLERALAAYDGALLVVSHDAAFLAAIGIERTENVAATTPAS